MFVACSTLCFGKYSLEDALRIIGDLRFSKVDLAIHEEGHHLKPSQVAADVQRAAQMLKTICPLGLAAYHVRIRAADHSDQLLQLRAVCRLARLTAVPVICVPAPPAAEDPVRAAQQLAELVKVANAEGIILTIETHMGTLAETPEGAIALCQQAPGLSLTLDPSHFLVGAARSQSFDAVFPYVKHVRLRDTGAGPHEFQVRVGQGQVDYGRIINLLERQHYDRTLTVDIRDIPDAAFAMEPEVRKLKYLLESLV